MPRGAARGPLASLPERAACDQMDYTLACLKEAYSGISQMEVVMVLFDFFQEYSQGNKTPNQYEADLCGLSERLDAARNLLFKSFQVMFMVHCLYS